MLKTPQKRKLALKAVFHDIRREVLEEYPDLPHIKLEPCYAADQDHAREKRVFCHWGHRKNVICHAAAFAGLPEENQRGVFYHEFGHVLDDYYEPEEDDPISRIEDTEVRADEIAKEWLGREIDYDKNDVQIIRKKRVKREEEYEE